MRRFLWLFLLTGFYGSDLNAKTIKDTIYINRGVFTAVDNSTFPYLAFNKYKTFHSENAIVKVSISDSLWLTVINNDTALHGFSLYESGLKGAQINSGKSYSILVFSKTRRIIPFYDSLEYPENRYLGLGGMICFDDYKNTNVQRYYWNLKEHDSLFNKQIVLGNAVDFSKYYPNYFTINGKSHPDLELDSTAVIRAKVGDTVRIFCLNSGQSFHSIHFHGFHTIAIFHSIKNQINWEKDTWGFPSMSYAILEFVPDKSGKYSVHDHNLVAVSGGGVHPNGMFLIMEIQ